MCTEIIHGYVCGLARSQLLQISNHQFRVQRIGMVKIVGRSLLQGQMGQIFVIGIVGNESDVFVTAQWWCGGVVVWWCGGVVVGGENIDIVGSITKCAHQERRTQERTAATILGTPPGTFDINSYPIPQTYPILFRIALATDVLPEPVPPAMATTRTGLSKRPLVGEHGLLFPLLTSVAIGLSVMFVDLVDFQDWWMTKKSKPEDCDCPLFKHSPFPCRAIATSPDRTGTPNHNGRERRQLLRRQLPNPHVPRPTVLPKTLCRTSGDHFVGSRVPSVGSSRRKQFSSIVTGQTCWLLAKWVAWLERVHESVGRVSAMVGVLDVAFIGPVGCVAKRRRFLASSRFNFVPHVQ